MKKTADIVKGLWGLNFTDSIRYIDDMYQEDFFDTFMAQKGVEKIFRNTLLSTAEKKEIIEELQNIFNCKNEDLQKVYIFISVFIPLSEEIIKSMKTIIMINLPDSLTCFYYCMGMFIEENPETIGLAKNTIIKCAKDCLRDDLESVNYALALSLEHLYREKRQYFYLLYQSAISYGVIVEKYDAISFGSEYIWSICVNEKRPKVEL